MMFPWFHRHSLALVATTYAKPRSVGSPLELWHIDQDHAERLRIGCTTFIWKCDHPDCDHVVTRTTLGKVIGEVNDV